MKTFEAVTTFNRDGLKLYGQRMITDFAKQWPQEVVLTVYSEGWDTWSAVPLLEASPWLTDFKRRHKDRKFKDFRWDAVRFAHKVAAVCHAARTTEADVLIWLDGDTRTHSPITLDDLDALAPAGSEWIAWLDRANQYPECGWYALNVRHPKHHQMVSAFEGMYIDDKLFGLPEWHDSYVLQHVVTESRIGTKSLSGEGRATGHPLVNGPLGRWFDHLKGPRKTEGKSRRSDLKVARPEAYWK